MHKQGRKWCNGCGEYTMHHKQYMISDGVGLILTLLTCGLFLILWIPLGIIDVLCQPWRCQRCGG